jgi:hypothetical protein
MFWIGCQKPDGPNAVMPTAGRHSDEGAGKIAPFVRLQHVTWLNVRDRVADHQVVSKGVAHDLTAGLQHALGYVHGAALLDLLYRVAESRGRNLRQRERSDLGKGGSISTPMYLIVNDLANRLNIGTIKSTHKFQCAVGPASHSAVGSR